MSYDPMGEQSDITLGEVGRRIAGLETAVKALSSQMQVALGPMSELKVRVDILTQDVNELGRKVDDVKSRGDRNDGIVAAVAFIGAIIPWPWKH